MRSAGLVITNFCNVDETISYPFPIIRGYVTHPDGQDCAEVLVKCRQCGVDRDSKNQVEKEDDGTAAAFETTWPVVNRSFRGVVRLEFGRNQVQLSAFLPRCDTTLHLEFFLNYVPAQTPSRFVLPVYIVCSDGDGSFQAETDEDPSLQSAVRRIATGAGLLQSATADSLVLEGFARKIFHLALDGSGLPRCEVFRTRLKTQDMHEMEEEALWRFLRRELRECFLDYGDGCKFLAFLAATRYCLPEDEEPPLLYEDLLKFVRGHVALGGSNLALYGTGCLYTWPETLEKLGQRLSDGRLVNRTAFLDDSAYRGQRWACFSTTLGAAWHELGHTFDLGHAKVGIMARGFEDIYELFTAAHPPPEPPAYPVSASVGVIHTSTNSSRFASEERPSVLPVSSLNSATSMELSIDRDATPAPLSNLIVHSPPAKPSRLSSNSVRVTFAPYLDIRRAPSSNSCTAMDTAVVEPQSAVLQRKESRSLASKVSGKLFGSKRKKMVGDGDTIERTPHPSQQSSKSLRGFPDDVSSVSSSCAISLSEPDSSAVVGDNSSVCTFSTRPSSITSATKQSRSWTKRFSLGGEEQQSFSTSTQQAPSVSHSHASAEKFSKAVVIKSYSMERYSVGDAPMHTSEQPAVTSLRNDTVPTPVTATQLYEVISPNSADVYSEKKVKMPWSRLFSKKKNKKEQELRLTPSLETEERQLPTIPSDQEMSQAPIVTTDQANQEIYADVQTVSVRKAAERAVKKDVQPSESSNDPCSPDSLADSMEDSLEDYQFSFAQQQPPVRYIATSVTQDIMGEIEYRQTEDGLPSPVVDEGEGNSSGVSSATPEPVYLDELRLRVSQRLQQVRQLQMANEPIEKPKPQLRARNVKEEQRVNRKGIRQEKPSITENAIARTTVQKKPATTSSHPVAPVHTSMKPRATSTTRTNQPRLAEGYIVGVERKESQEKPNTSAVEKELSDSSEDKTLARGRRGSQPEDALTTPPHTTATRSKSAPKPSTKNPVAPITDSKLRYPLRTQPAKKSSEVKDGNHQPKKPQSDMTSSRTTLNHIPTQSTQSSRGKEAKVPVKKPSETSTTKPAKKAVVLTNTPMSRQTVNRRSSRKKKATKNSTTKPSQRMDFNHMPVPPNQPTLRHCRSASRDSICGSLGDFMMSESEDREKDDAEIEVVKEEDIIVEEGHRGNMASLQRKQHFSSLINTPSGISVIEEDVPHRLPLPLLPPLLRKEASGKGVVSSGGPKWTKECASILNHHKWFNTDSSTLDNDAPDKLPRLAGRLLWSENGFRVIELRSPCGEVLQHWNFTEERSCKSFMLPIQKSAVGASETSKFTVVAIDARGNLLNRTVRGDLLN